MKDGEKQYQISEIDGEFAVYLVARVDGKVCHTHIEQKPTREEAEKLIWRLSP